MAAGDIAVLEGIGEGEPPLEVGPLPIGRILRDPSFQTFLLGVGAGFLLNGKWTAGASISVVGLALRPDVRQALAPHIRLPHRVINVTDGVRTVGNGQQPSPDPA